MQRLGEAVPDGDHQQQVGDGRPRRAERGEAREEQDQPDDRDHQRDLLEQQDAADAAGDEQHGPQREHGQARGSPPG